MPVAYFLNAGNNPNCGPLRHKSCADIIGEPGMIQNATACAAQIQSGRQNLAIFTEVLLPVSWEEIEISSLISGGGGSEGNTTTTTATRAECNAGCWISLALSAVFSSVALLVCGLLMCIWLFFVRKQVRRPAGQQASRAAASRHPIPRAASPLSPAAPDRPMLTPCAARLVLQARRLNRELDAAKEECSTEHHDKVKLLRYAGVSLD